VKRSTDRILTTHIGSLPRPAGLLDAARARAAGRGDEQAYARLLRDAVHDVVHRQLDVGLDIIDDGEFSKPGFIHYINERLAGFEPSDQPGGSPFAGSREWLDFPRSTRRWRAAGHPTRPALPSTWSAPARSPTSGTRSS
jgi:5-methyltetrahydropteroyltriglutamate--homocysteine methyltransferase